MLGADVPRRSQARPSQATSLFEIREGKVAPSEHPTSAFDTFSSTTTMESEKALRSLLKELVQRKPDG
jgi:hypothetical protein